MHFLSRKGFCCIAFIFCTVLAISRSSSWDPDMPGGMKLVIDGETFSFTTDVCSGGVFFKAPVYIQLKCLHGYFLARPNGCSLARNTIVGGQNYVCQRVNKDKANLIQALIPVTNSDHPLDHTFTLFDNPNTLKNLRRYTYTQGLEGNYESTGSRPVGVIVTNAQKTPSINFDSFCYEGQTQHSAFSYMAILPSNLKTDVKGDRLFTQGCDTNSIKLPTGQENVYNFSQGYSDPNLFEGEKVATLPKGKSSEIWGGLAYCLQANVTVSEEGKLRMRGIKPSIESLEKFCPKKSQEVGSLHAKGHLREKRGVSSSPAFDTLMTCVSTCWKNNPDKCHQPFPETFRLPLCPPYCGGKYRHRASLPIRPVRSAFPEYPTSVRTRRQAYLDCLAANSDARLLASWPPVRNVDDLLKASWPPVRNVDDLLKASWPPVRNVDDLLKASWPPVRNVDDGLMASWPPVRKVDGVLMASWPPVRNVDDALKASWPPVRNVDDTLRASWPPVRNVDGALMASWPPVRNVDDALRASWPPVRNVDGALRASWPPVRNVDGALMASWPPVRNVDGALRASWPPVRNVDGALMASWPPVRNVDGALRASWPPVRNVDGALMASWPPVRNVDGALRASWPPVRNVDDGLKASWPPVRKVDDALMASWPPVRKVDDGLMASWPPVRKVDCSLFASWPPVRNLDGSR